MNAFAAGSSADISSKNIEVNPSYLQKNQSKQYQLHDGLKGPFAAAQYAPVSAMQGMGGAPSAQAPLGSSTQNASSEQIYGMSN